MADYFSSEYASFIGAKGLPSPADTPYETPAFIRSKRSSRATAGSSREPSPSPPPLPPDSTEQPERGRDGRYGALDPRRFTPTLHASLVSEILSLRRELDSKNSLVENLETSLSHAKSENDTLTHRLSESAREVRRAKAQVAQMEKGTYDAVEDLVKERDAARVNAEDLRSKFDNVQKKARQQDEDAERTQSIWENEKETWDSERRQLERRVHVTESRLRAVVEEMNAQQASLQNPSTLPDTEDSVFKDSGIGNESDTASVRSATTPVKHKRNMSSVSFKPRNPRFSTMSRGATGTPEPQMRPGHTLADELGIDEEDEYDIDEFENQDDEIIDYHAVRQQMESRQSLHGENVEGKAKRVLGLAPDVPESPTTKERSKQSLDILSATRSSMAQSLGDAPAPAAPASQTEPVPEPQPLATRSFVYVDRGYQPSPPASPPRVQVQSADATAGSNAQEENLDDFASPMEPSEAEIALQSKGAMGPKSEAPPISPPQTPIVENGAPLDDPLSPKIRPSYSTTSTQTDLPELWLQKPQLPDRNSLSPSMFVPSIAIHPPSSRPSSPRPYVLPPGTKNVSTQVELRWSGKDASMQTEEIRVDRRPVKLPPHLLPNDLLPSPTFPERAPSRQKRVPGGGTAKIYTKIPPINTFCASPPLVVSPTESSPDLSREKGAKGSRNLPLKALPLPRPVLSPVLSQGETFGSNGPLNRTSQYGVSSSKQDSQQLADIDQSSDDSDNEEPPGSADVKDIAGVIPGAASRPPQGRFGLSEPPKAVPEDKEVSPERRPNTAGSYGAAPAPSISSSRAGSSLKPAKPPPKLNAHKDHRSRSPSFGSMASSVSQSQSTQSALPPYPIPNRSSSRIASKTLSEGSQSPTPHDLYGSRSRHGRTVPAKQPSLRKVHSAAAIREKANRSSPPKHHRRRRRSPDLTPVQSMAFESPTPTKFPIPELPTPLQDGISLDFMKGSVDMSKSTMTSSHHRVLEEANLVDAIAATMVGEWMWKYIRKRKSFGITEDNAEIPVQDENGVVNVTAHGTRHKRWVWLSPYERTIMWDTKQPTSGPALLGKKGRKLSIQSVLDVEDDTPVPKGAELETAWKRSILILTPARALKFTTVSAERHALWMTALGFLAQPSQVPNQIPTMPAKPPPPPPMEILLGRRPASPSFGRANVRDSIRIAKGKMPDLPQIMTNGEQITVPEGLAMDGDVQDDGADFPAVPRLYIGTTRHQRKRSNTSPRLPQPLHNLRSFSSSMLPSSASSALHPGSNHGPSSRGGPLATASSKSGSRGNSIASPDRPNFFEAVGTVRMEAFVDPNVRDGVLYVPAPPPAIGAPRRRRGDSNLSQTTTDRRRAGYVFDENGLDPFKGF